MNMLKSLELNISASVLILGVALGTIKETNSAQISRKRPRYSEEQISPHIDKNKELLRVAKEGDRDQVKKLIAEGASVDATDGTGWTILMHAATHKDVKLTDFLLKLQAVVHCTNNLKQTALHRAVIDTIPSQVSEAVRIMRLLLSAGARYDCADEGGFTPLDYALKISPELVQVLLEHDMNKPTAPPRVSASEAQTITGQVQVAVAPGKRIALPPELNSLFAPDERATLYEYLERKRWEGVKSMLIQKALQHLAKNRQNIREARSFFFRQANAGAQWDTEGLFVLFGKA